MHLCRYDVIWMQWALLYLTDSEILLYASPDLAIEVITSFPADSGLIRCLVAHGRAS